MIVAGSQGPRPDPAPSPGSLRRTTTTDGQRPLGIDGPIELRCRAGDSFTASDLVSTSTAEVTLRVSIDSEEGFVITGIGAVPEPAGLQDLLGSSARRGFRRRVSDLDLEVGTGDVLLRRLLEDVPITASLSRLADLHDQAAGQRREPGRRIWRSYAPVDVCAGWASGSLMHRLVQSGQSPVLDHDDDAVAPPPVGGDRRVDAAVAPGAFRRWRRLDVSLVGTPGGGTSGAGSVIHFDGTFRDSFVAADGVERVEHEYGFDGSVDRASGRLTACHAEPRVLPASECSSARASADLLIGCRLDEVAATVRRSLVGTPSCTHLSDALHSIADVPDMIRVLEGR